jgi:hypothetical protein
MKRARKLVLLLMGFAAMVLPAGAQRLSVDPNHPYSASEQKQSEKLYSKQLKAQEKAQKRNEKARQKAYKQQQKQMKKDNAARQKQIDASNHH